MALRTFSGNSSHRVMHSARTRAPSGSSETEFTSGPTSASRRSSWPSTIAANPWRTPCMSLRWSQRDTCTTTRSSRDTGPAPPRIASDGCPESVAPSNKPTLTKSLSTWAGRKGRFFVAKGSIEGAITYTSAPGLRSVEGRSHDVRRRMHHSDRGRASRTSKPLRCSGWRAPCRCDSATPPGRHAEQSNGPDRRSAGHARPPRHLRSLGSQVRPRYVYDRLVVGGFVRAQDSVVASESMDPIVNALGDLEETLIALDRRPIGRRCRYQWSIRRGCATSRRRHRQPTSS